MNQHEEDFALIQFWTQQLHAANNDEQLGEGMYDETYIAVCWEHLTPLINRMHQRKFIAERTGRHHTQVELKELA